MTQTKEGTIRVEQMLHGYSGGHRLLATSRSLSKSGERLARMMSDLSGAAFKSGFDGYVTGYPLHEDEMFAIAKTWFAREQQRPGCVWTHTLLISFDDLGSFDAFPQLLTSYRRPSDGDFKEYGDPLLLPAVGGRLRAEEPIDYIESVIESTYSCGDDIIALPAMSAAEHESLLFAMWRQQWASLRSRFSFCTGALELRVGELRLDVQVIPADKRQVEKASRNATIIESSDGAVRHSGQLWASAAACELVNETDDSFKNFLETYADAEHCQRVDFQRYGACFADIRGDKPIGVVLTGIAATFPTETEAKALKFAVAGPQEERSYLQTSCEEVILHSLLVDDVGGGAFDFEQLRVWDRFGTVWRKDEEKAWQLLMQAEYANRQKVVDRLVDVGAALVSDEFLAKSASAQCKLVARMLATNWLLGKVREVWKCAECTVFTLGDEFLDEARRSTDCAKSVYSAWITENREDCARALADSIGAAVAPLVLSLDPQVLSEMDRKAGKWHAVLRDESDSCLWWLKESRVVSSEAACLALLGVAPSKIEMDESLQHVWHEANVRRPELTSRTLLYAYAKMLTGSFGSPHRGVSEVLAKLCFPVVYEAAMNNVLPEESWSILHDRLPKSGLWWDRCKQLRMGLLECCVRNEWSVETFVYCTAVGEAFELVLGSWGLDHGEKAFLADAIELVLGSGTKVTNEQRKAAEKYSYWF